MENCWSEENRIQRIFSFFSIMAMFSCCYFWRKGWGGSLALILGMLSQALAIWRRMCGCVLRIPSEGLYMHSFHRSSWKENWKQDIVTPPLLLHVQDGGTGWWSEQQCSTSSSQCLGLRDCWSLFCECHFSQTWCWGDTTFFCILFFLSLPHVSQDWWLEGGHLGQIIDSFWVRQRKLFTSRMS